MLQLTVAYLNATINVKTETQNQRLQSKGLAKPRKTRRLMGIGPVMARQESAGQVFGWVWHHTHTVLRSNPRPLAGYADPLQTLCSDEYARIHACTHIYISPCGTLS
jgi:hypothetical protein